MVFFRNRRPAGSSASTRPTDLSPDPVADWRGQVVPYRVARGDFPGYREIHIVAVKYGLKAADWESPSTAGSAST